MRQALPIHRRWWIVALILGLGLLILIWNGWWREVTYRQQRIVTKILTIAIAGALAWAWLVFLSPLEKALRKRLAYGTAAAIGLFLLVFSVRGFTGDLEPIIALRWLSDRPSTPSAPRAKAVAPGANAPIWRNSPQFLGPSRDANVPGVRLATDWHETPPEELWRRPVGAGWAGFAVAGRRAITLEKRGENEAIVCYGALDGEQRWVHEVEGCYKDEIAGDGPRSTPTIVGQRIYATTGTGVLVCLEPTLGKLVWKVDVVATNGAEVPEWGYSCSPWVAGGQVVVTPGSLGGVSLVAYDADTGEKRWTGGTDEASYSSPTVYSLSGLQQFVVLNAHTLQGIHPKTGVLLWSTDWKFPNPNVCQPLVMPGGRVFISSGYGAGCALFTVKPVAGTGFEVAREWKTLNLKSKFSSYVQKGGLVYGLDDGTLTCIQLQSGRRVWKGARYGHGQVLLVGEVLLVSGEDGSLTLLKASSEGHRVLSRIRALSGRGWNPPAFAAPLIYLRNDEEAVCFKLPLQ